MTETAERADESFGALIAQGFGAVLKPPRVGVRGLALIVAFVFVGWLATSIYRVQPDEQGVVLRFGKLVDTTDPGLHFHLPWPIETVLFPKVTKINEIQLGGGVALPGDPNAGRERQTLTGDENIVEADGVGVLEDPRSPANSCSASTSRSWRSRSPPRGRCATSSAARRSRRRCRTSASRSPTKTRALLQRLLDKAHSGVEITQVQLQRVEPPLAVIDAFNDVQRARADQERARNEAQAYANDILPRARGEADHTREDAEGYRASVVTLADGEAQGVPRRARRLSGGAARHLLAALHGSRRRSAEKGVEGPRRHLRQGFRRR